MEPGDLFIPMESIEEEATLSCDAKGIPPPQYRDDLSDDLAAVYFARIHYGRRCSVARERRLRGPQHYGPVSYHMQRLESVLVGLFRQPPEAPEAPSLSAARLNPAVKPDIWSLNGTLINLSLDRRRRLSGGNLIISSLDRYQDVGQYQCMAYNTVGAILSRRASLQFAFLDHFKVHTRSGVSVREGQGVVLLCGTPTSSGDLTYAWIFNEYPYFVQQDNRRFVSQRTGNLYIAKVEPSDVGNYTCVVMNSVTKGKVQSSPTSLILRPGGEWGREREKEKEEEDEDEEEEEEGLGLPLALQSHCSRSSMASAASFTPPVSSCWKLGISSTALEYFIFTLLGKGTPLARFHLFQSAGAFSSSGEDAGWYLRLESLLQSYGNFLHFAEVHF
ncbi:hypothetical protein CRUP_028443 [Coryphaenoides rupestris]|nr:hypothetical protein CRUP_028443 [Coryphaenoides rupestris]